jgi:hypothetical protein
MIYAYIRLIDMDELIRQG